MLTVSDTAGAHLAELLTAANAPAELAVRFVIEKDGLALQLDSERPGDATFQHAERTVLLLDEEVSQLLTEKTLDIHEHDDGPHLALS
jgi:hypothetical protein